MRDSIEAYDDWAEYYDLLYRHTEIGDADFYIDEARATDGAVLEIGCGTGRIYLEMLAQDIDADGIDIAPRMLEQLRRKARDRDLEPSVQQADMTSFDLDREYALIIIPFRTFLHNITPQEQEETLERCYEHLEDGGRLLLNFFQPDHEYIVDEYGRPTVSRFTDDGTEYVLMDHSRYIDQVEGLVRMEKELISMEDGQLAKEDLTIRPITKHAFELLCEQSSFDDWTVYGGFDKQELENTDQELVWELQKR